MALHSKSPFRAPPVFGSRQDGIKGRAAPEVDSIQQAGADPGYEDVSEGER